MPMPSIAICANRACRWKRSGFKYEMFQNETFCYGKRRSLRLLVACFHHLAAVSLTVLNVCARSDKPVNLRPASGIGAAEFHRLFHKSVENLIMNGHWSTLRFG